jgi:hypothetical protein
MRFRKAMLLVGFLACGLPVLAEQERWHYVHMLVFESYATKLPDNFQSFDSFDLPSNDFPLKFSRLFIPFSQSETVQFPSGLSFPKSPMFLDIRTFKFADEQVKKKKSFAHYNPLERLNYKIKLLSCLNGGYQTELSGRHEDFKFKNLKVDLKIDKTKIIRIRRTANRIIYIAMTSIAGPDAVPEVEPAQPAEKPWAIYPSELLNTNWLGYVRILLRITSEGKADEKSVILLDCRHYLLGRNSLDTVLNQWTFKPATRNGAPVAYNIIAEVEFKLPKPRGRDMRLEKLP